MRVVEHKYYFSIEDVFLENIFVGFTKPNLSGKIPNDIEVIFSELNKTIKIAHLNQIHSSKINFIKEAGLYIGDGLFTGCKNLTLVVRTADCLPVFFANSNKIGLVHMGWRGAVEGILNNLDYKLSNFKVIAGVGLRSCCYKVGEEFLNYKEISSYLINREGNLYFDPINFLLDKLIKKGLKEKNFFDIGICSFCFPAKFYSFRRDKTTFRTISFIMKSK
ncbi:MAG: polyphenol oxidase family protein [Candidatus Aenigmatarchaeota archaeon]